MPAAPEGVNATLPPVSEEPRKATPLFVVSDGTGETAAAVAKAALAQFQVEGPLRRFGGIRHEGLARRVAAEAEKVAALVVFTLVDRRVARALIEESASANAPPGSEVRKLGDLFASFMDEAAIEAKGVSPLAPELGRIAAIANRKELATALGDTLRADVDALNTGRVTTDRLLGLWVSEDLNEPSRYAAYLLQGGLGLPDRDYYLSDDAKLKSIRDKYQPYVRDLLALAATPDPDAGAKKIYAIESRIAAAHWTRVQNRDAEKTYNRYDRAALGKLMPSPPWVRPSHTVATTRVPSAAPSMAIAK